MQYALFHIRFGQHDRTGHQGDAKFLGQAAEQLLVVCGHLLGLHAQVRIGAPVVAVSAKNREAIAQRVAQFQPLLGFAALGNLIQLALLSARPQPGTDVFRQHDHRARVHQALGAGLLQIGCELAVQALQVLIVARVQQWFDTEQVAVLARDAMVKRQFDAQVGQVVAFRALLGPEAIAAEGGDHHQRQGACQEFSHQAWVFAKSGVAIRNDEAAISRLVIGLSSALHGSMHNRLLIIPKEWRWACNEPRALSPGLCWQGQAASVARARRLSWMQNFSSNFSEPPNISAPE
ncbi:hypothetical protein D3C76_542520 [compost metagenome]